ncbi:B-type cyclin [Coemansia sp. RSA 1813]|nr:B-type cyclin [Coemansia sp. RSA 1843]KAJ2215631.1 B-type cyclin [Coemansia sp. RSA 487]KAJ2568823.1 B-type cyclin [Coemansia sp. RSA 1813]
MFQNRASFRSQNTRIPVRRTVAAINDENKVSGNIAHVGKANEPAKPMAAGKFRPGAPARTTAIPVKAFGASSSIIGVPAQQRPRAALSNVSIAKNQGPVSKLVKPGEIAGKLTNRLGGRAGRVVPLSGIAKPLASSGVARPIATAVAPAARPPANAIRAPAAAQALRPISKPAAVFGAGRRARPLSSGGSQNSSFSEAAVASSFKRARTADSSAPAGPAASSSVLGKHTRSGRSPPPQQARPMSHIPASKAVPAHVEAVAASAPPAVKVAPVDRAPVKPGFGTTGTQSQSDDSASTAVNSETSSSARSSIHVASSPMVDTLGELKLIENDTLDYALHHTGLLHEHPIMMDEINAFEADVDPLDTTLIPEFSDDIFGYMRELEVSLMPNPNYVAKQPMLSWPTRAILIEWLVQVHHRFNLLPETLYLCVNFVDRFLSAKEIVVNKLQLVGAVSLLIAAKYEEIHIPSVKDMEYMVEKNYSEEEILRAERYILRMLNFDLGWPGPLSFLRRISKADDYDMATRTLAKYLIEVTLIDERFIGVPCSKVAATAHYLALRFLDKGPWTRAHAFYSGYFESELLPHAMVLVELLMQPRRHRAIYEKYADRRFLRASEFIYQWFKVNTPDMVLRPTMGDVVPDSSANSSDRSQQAL